MKRILFSSFFSILCISTLYAVSAKPGITKITQPDGYQLSTLQRGDETFHFRTTTDQYVLLLDEQGYLAYAVPNATGELLVSSIRAHNVNERNEQEITFLQTIKPNLPFGVIVKQNIKLKVLQKATQNKRMNAAKVKSTTAPHFLVILVEFSDNSFAIIST